MLCFHMLCFHGSMTFYRHGCQPLDRCIWLGSYKPRSNIDGNSAVVAFRPRSQKDSSIDSCLSVVMDTVIRIEAQSRSARLEVTAQADAALCFACPISRLLWRTEAVHYTKGRRKTS